MTKRRKLHIDDAMNEAAAIAEGAQGAKHFCLAHAEALMMLIATYPDDTAHDALDALREAFWGAPRRQWQALLDTELREKMLSVKTGRARR